MEKTLVRTFQPIWTFVSIAASGQGFGTPYTLFTATKSGSNRLTDTNLTTSGKIPYPKFYCVGISAQIYSDANTGKLPGLDMNAARQNLSVRFEVNQLKRCHAILGDIPSGPDITGSFAVGTTTTTYSALNGAPMISNYFPLRRVEEINNTTDTIGGVLNVENAWTPATAFKVRITLLGFIEQAQGLAMSA